MFFARRSIFTACLLVTGTATSVFAGGFGGSSAPVTQIPAPIPIPDYANTFYLRGDVGWALYQAPDFSDSIIGFRNGDMGDTYSLGAGFGYNFRDTIRGDITVDYLHEVDVSATNPDGANHRAVVSSAAVLANVYYDMRGRDRLSPYIGGGLGFAYNQTKGHSVNNVDGTRGKSQFEFAGALMAGFSYRMDDRWMLDAGYRYLYLGDAKTESLSTNGLKVEDIRAHELRVGVRYEFQ